MNYAAASFYPSPIRPVSFTKPGLTSFVAVVSADLWQSKEVLVLIVGSTAHDWREGQSALAPDLSS